MKALFILMGLFFIANGTAIAQAAPKKTSVSIQTSGICDECKVRIEGAVKKVKGVKVAAFDTDTKKVSVTYITKKADVAAIRNAISKVGYAADEVKANQEAYDALPKCCRVGGHD